VWLHAAAFVCGVRGGGFCMFLRGVVYVSPSSSVGRAQDS